MIVIETPRLLMRHYTLDDVDALAEVLCDHDNMRFFPNRFERKDAEEWIEKNMRRYAEDGVGGWALVLKPDNKFAGYCGLVRREVDGATEIEVGYAPRPPRPRPRHRHRSRPRLHGLRVHNSRRRPHHLPYPPRESSVTPRS